MRKSEIKKKYKQRKRRVFRVRKKISGNEKNPRLCIYKSLRHIYAQIIDDTKGKTLTSASTLSPQIKEELTGKNKSEKSRVVGKLIAERAKEIGIENVVFDRHGFKYQGRVKTLAEAARETGLKF